MAERFLGLQMAWQWAWQGIVWKEAQGQYEDTYFLSVTRHMPCVKYLVCSFFSPTSFFFYQIVQDEEQTTATLLHSHLAALQRCELRALSIKWNICPHLLQETLSVLPNMTNKSFIDASAQKVTFLQQQGPSLPTALFSTFIIKNNSTQTSSVSYRFLWLQ